jgi:hypothetical protein
VKPGFFIVKFVKSIFRTRGKVKKPGEIVEIDNKR